MQSTLRFHRPALQSGWLLLEFSLALVLATGYAVVRAQSDFDAAVDLQVRARAQGLETVHAAAVAYAERYFDQIVGMPAPGTLQITGSAIHVAKRASPAGDMLYQVADGNHPDVSDLVALRLLPANFSGAAIGGGRYRIALEVTPPGCRQDCSIEGAVYVDQPFRVNGKIQHPRTGRAVQLLGADGAASRPENPAVLSGYGGRFTLPNPAGDVAGILAERFGYYRSSQPLPAGASATAE
ncbi:hypothetical protein [Noviherbaspirillum pedocola]|uniref:Uncharacterized protein n=1 Tax=Noviherbaspirillum pedocola TaxID=2801341 RepID=A0A934SVV3_9BURK|nr:hypothetical protein [Noviherbaspirillum pedocola]MBK4736086.1 hypothetical protein [Noviherbaspirillum pedocola]